uniref:GCF C-terminal domain-containing protein n=1 Tax=Glossina palpalis gambiensis TaxID=67801 RepID=A0A1B0C2L7_9MUSC
MAALLDYWAPLFPSWILDSVLEQLVLPRLHVSVKSCDPLTDTAPIHIWILPWNSTLGHKIEELIYPSIRDKLGNALQALISQDRSARAMLTPWKGAFDSQEMEVFFNATHNTEIANGFKLNQYQSSATRFGMLSEDLLNEPNIKEYLRKALEIMHRVADSVIKDGPPPQSPPTTPALVDLQMSGTNNIIN